MSDSKSEDPEKEIEKRCIRGAWLLLIIQFILFFAQNECSIYKCITAQLIDILICLVIAVIPLILAYKIVKKFPSSEYDNKSIPDLRSEKDQYTFWGAGGTLFLATLNTTKFFPEMLVWLLMLSAAYILIIFGIQYRRLSAAIYRKEENQQKSLFVTMNGTTYMVSIIKA